MFTTRKKPLIDNDKINQGAELFLVIQSEQKTIKQKMTIIRGAIRDFYTHSKDGLNNIEKNFVADDYSEAYQIYLKTSLLYKSVTRKKQHILYLLFIQRFRVCDIAQLLKIKAPTVIEHIQDINKKAIKQDFTITL